VVDTDVSEVVAGAGESHRRLSGAIESLTDEQARSASLLPGWSVGHVLTHLARNADSHARMMRAAMAGDAVPQYGPDYERTAGIEAGAARPAAALIEDVGSSAAALEAVWDEMTDAAWAGHGFNEPHEEIWPCRLMPFHRWREVELHHLDLGLGYTSADWPAGYVDRELAVSLQSLPERITEVDRQRLLGWLVGRDGSQPALDLEPWQARRDHYLRV
jgi:maleylpyruvate isomerase